MVEQSPRFGLNTGYEQGEDNWSHNDTVNFLDEIAEERGPIADRPSSGTYDTEVYHATDENLYYRWDESGSEWNAIAGKGSEGSPLPGTAYREAISTDEALINSVLRANAPEDWVNPTTGEDTPAVIRTNDANRALALQVQNDEKEDSEGDLKPGYSATIDWLSTEGERIGRLAGDPGDRHLHVYVKADAVGSGDTQPRPHTRFEADADWTTLYVGDIEEADTRIVVGSPVADGSSRIVFNNQESSQMRMEFKHFSGTGDTFRFYDHQNSIVPLSYDFSVPRWNFEGTATYGLREITNPSASDLINQEWAWDATNSRWLYRDSDGTAHYFTPDGTL